MKGRKGFTLIELMVVVLIVAILAAVAIPILRGRIDAAKWSEGKAMMGSIATAIRAYAGEHGDADWALAGSPIGMAPGTLQAFVAGDLTGTYFSDSDFTYTATFVQSTNALTFTITCVAGGGGGSGNPPTAPGQYTLDQDGSFVGT